MTDSPGSKSKEYTITSESKGDVERMDTYAESKFKAEEAADEYKNSFEIVKLFPGMIIGKPIVRRSDYAICNIMEMFMKSKGMSKIP